MRRWLPLLGLFACSSSADERDCLVTAAASQPPTNPVRDVIAPSAAHLDLMDAEARFVGAQRALLASPLRWGPEELATWRSPGPDTLRYSSPLLFDYPNVQSVTLSVRPNGARWVEVLPSPDQVPTTHGQAMRGLRIPLEGDGVVSVVVPLDAALRENWGDEQLTPPMARLIVDLPRREPWPELLEVRLDDDPLTTGVAPAWAGLFELDEVRHPGWVVHPGASVRVQAPALNQAGTLSWYDGGPVGGALTVSVQGQAVNSAPTGTSWRPRSLDLPVRDEPALLEFTNTGTGPVLVGSPRIDPRADDATNVLIYLVDTLRADHLGAWGGVPSDRTPILDRIAAEGVRFARAHSTGCWTKPTLPTLLTGAYPMAHQVGLHGYADRLPAGMPTLQGALSRAGWRTGSFTASPLGSTLSGLEVGFGTAVPPVAWANQLGPLGHPSASQLHSALWGWIDEAPDQPWAALVHTLEVHAWRRTPYASPAPGWTSYETAVADMDRELGLLLEGLHARGQLDNTVLVFVSDHGESFGEHGVQDHGTGLYQEQIHVPLLVWAPGHIDPGVVTDTVSLADVTPTVLDLFGLDPLPTADGVSLVPYLSGAVAEPLRDGAPSARMRFIAAPDALALFAWTDADGGKILLDGAREVAVDLAADACEASPAAPGAALSKRLSEWRVDTQASGGARATATSTASDALLLQQLGYVE